MWVRGLKQGTDPTLLACDRSHPMWVRGLKLYQSPILASLVLVAPYVGAWIETLL